MRACSWHTTSKPELALVIFFLTFNLISCFSEIFWIGFDSCELISFSLLFDQLSGSHIFFLIFLVATLLNVKLVVGGGTSRYLFLISQASISIKAFPYDMRNFLTIRDHFCTILHLAYLFWIWFNLLIIFTSFDLLSSSVDWCDVVHTVPVFWEILILIGGQRSL